MCDPSALRRRDERHLVRELRAGCPAALAEVDRRYRSRLHAHGARLLRGTGHDAEDLVQDTLERAWTALPGRDADVDLARWLHAVQRNRARSLRRLHPGRDVALERAARAHADVTSHVLAAEELRETVELVSRLPSRQREALVRIAVNGETHKAAARHMATSEAVTRLLVSRAVTRLRAHRRLAAAGALDRHDGVEQAPEGGLARGVRHNGNLAGRRSFLAA